MGVHVFVEITFLRKSSLASTHGALKWTITIVCSQVIKNILPLVEYFLTILIHTNV